jgi:hypothetical protein
MAKLLTALIIFGAAVGVFFSLALPALNIIKIDNTNSAMLSTAITKFQDLEKKRNEVVAKYSSVSNEDVKKLNIALPTQITAVNLVAQIDDMIKARGMVLKSINIEDTQSFQKKELTASGEEQKYNTASIVFVASGSYEVFLSMLSDLVKSLQIIDIKEISFAVGAKADSYEFSVRAITYYAGNQ